MIYETSSLAPLKFEKISLSTDFLSADSVRVALNSKAEIGDTIRKSGDTDVGPLHLSGDLSVGQDVFIGSKCVHEHIQEAIDNTFDVFVEEGHIDQKLSIMIEDNKANAGFYTVFYDDERNTVLLGTYNCGMCIYDVENNVVRQCSCDNNEEFKSARFKNIAVNPDETGVRYIALDQNTSVTSQFRGIYMSDDGTNWTYVDSDFVNGNKSGPYKFEMFAGLIYKNGFFYTTGGDSAGNKSVILKISATDRTVETIDINDVCARAIYTVDDGVTALFCESNSNYIVKTCDMNNSFSAIDEGLVLNSAIKPEQMNSVQGPWIGFTDDGKMLIAYSGQSQNWTKIYDSVAVLTYDSAAGKFTNAKNLILNEIDKNETFKTSRSVIKKNGVYLMCTYDGRILYSFDMINWSVYRSLSLEHVSSVEGMTVVGGKFLIATRHSAVGDATVLYKSNILIDLLQLGALRDMNSRVDSLVRRIEQLEARLQEAENQANDIVQS